MDKETPTVESVLQRLEFIRLNYIPDDQNHDFEQLERDIESLLHEGKENPTPKAVRATGADAEDSSGIRLKGVAPTAGKGDEPRLCIECRKETKGGYVGFSSHGVPDRVIPCCEGCRDRVGVKIGKDEVVL